MTEVAIFQFVLDWVVSEKINCISHFDWQKGHTVFLEAHYV
jgi:hypothetical protein